ncbi:FAD:protein FMN transferase [Bifidobacterium aesculapii]|uniref:FAD:protein FMN transferase n=1 Tax=Bifidobacterium aesculapii TaxID=1329411 RepID=UPI00278C0CF0|nr:FAD:protein FMN transferase [Bifidobacterium aesculapii]
MVQHTMAFPDALGTGVIIQWTPAGDAVGDEPSVEAARRDIAALIDGYESVLSRFRGDSTVSAMRAGGGAFDFPDWAGPLFDLCDVLCAATDGAFDPCVGEDLIRLGYDARYSFTMAPGAAGSLGAIHGRPTWRGDVERRGTTTLVTTRPVALDFGACGKGYLVDLIAAVLRSHDSFARGFVIDAGGDLLVETETPIAIGLEDPRDPNDAVGVAHVGLGAFCASAPSRRHWTVPGVGAPVAVHHLIDAVSGTPVDDVVATWVHVPAPGLRAAPRTTDETAHAMRLSAMFPTALADGLATALFTTDPNVLHDGLCGLHGPLAMRGWPSSAFSCAVLKADRTAVVSTGFPGTLFAH